MWSPGQGREAAKRTLDAVATPFIVDVGEWGLPRWENRPVARKNDLRDAELLRAIGHAPEGIEAKESEFFHTLPSGERIGKFRFHCSCGYHSTYRATFKGAVEAGVVHMRNMAAEYRRNGGVSLHGKQASTG